MRITFPTAYEEENKLGSIVDITIQEMNEEKRDNYFGAVDSQTHQKINNLLKNIEKIWVNKYSYSTKVDIRYNFPNILTNEPILSSENKDSMYLGLFFTLYYEYNKKYRNQNKYFDKPNFDNVCLTGSLKKNLTPKEIMNGEKIIEGVGYIEKKITGFVRNTGKFDTASCFGYVDDKNKYSEEQLKEIAQEENPDYTYLTSEEWEQNYPFNNKVIVIKKIESFEDLVKFIFQKPLTGSIKPNNSRTAIYAGVALSIVLLAVVITFVFSGMLNDDTVEFEDDIFEKLIREIINKPDGEIREPDLVNIERIYYKVRFEDNDNDHIKISNIEGIEHIRNLEELELINQNIVDISPLRHLTKLTFINLNGNNIKNIIPLKNLSNVENIDLKSNNISDLTALKIIFENDGFNHRSPRVNVENNPINFTGMEIVKRLDNAGIMVEYEERDRR